MFRWLLNVVSDKSSADIIPDGVGGGFDSQSFSLFLVISLVITWLLLIVIWGIMYSKIKKLKDENEELKEKITKLKSE